MKKLVVSVLTIFGFALFANAQNISENAIGLRLGDSDALGTEITYQRAIFDTNRIELDLGWRNGSDFDGIKLAGIYQWVWELDGNFNWYAGVGGGLASFDYQRTENKSDDSFVFIAGDIGVEYDFDIPLLLSLDFRPEIGFGEDVYDNDDLGFDIAFSIRYQF